MSRMEGVAPTHAGPIVRIAYRLTRRELRRITGRGDVLTGDMPIRAHRPWLLAGYGALEKTVQTRTRVPEHLRALAVLKASVMLGCEMCRDLGSVEARSAGVSDEQQLDLHRYRDSEHFDATERLVLDLAVGMTLTPVQVDDELFDALRRRFEPAELVELAHLIAVESLRSRFNATFAVGSAGFGEGLACARMERGAADMKAAAVTPTPRPVEVGA